MRRADPPSPLSQLELNLQRQHEPDRNRDRGGRSFYFFDFDDNVLFLTTSIFLFHKETGKETAISTGEFARWSHTVGKSGPFRDHEIRFDDQLGSFRRFRDQNLEALRKMQKQQPFIEDLAHALGQPDFSWKGPSWHTFYHAAFNLRPLSVITARGHDPKTIKEGISLLVGRGYLPSEPNYLSVYPVSHTATRHMLGDIAQEFSTAELKRRAIMASVDKAMEVYGNNAHHRFGMSDDDPKNIELIIEAMTKMKEKYSENSFFVIDTHQERYIKQEIFVNLIKTEYIEPNIGSGSASGAGFDPVQQLELF